MRMMLVPICLALLLGCAPGPRPDCTAQGFTPGSAGYSACVDAGGAPIATGPGSPYAYRDIPD